MFDEEAYGETFVRHEPGRRAYGEQFVGDNGPWVAVLDDDYYPVYGTPESIGVGLHNGAFVINDAPWADGSPDNQIFSCLAFNSLGDTAWAQQPGGALLVNVSSFGLPSIVNYDGVVFYGTPGFGSDWSFSGDARGRFGGAPRPDGGAVDSGPSDGGPVRLVPDAASDASFGDAGGAF